MINSLRYKIIVQQFKNKVYSYSFYILRNRMDAEDVTQEVLLILWKNIEKINFIAAKTWIMKTTYNKCIDYLRKRKRILSKEQNIGEEEEALNYLNNVLPPDLLLEKKLIQSKIQEALGKLNDTQKQILVLYEIQGLKYKEISKVLEIPINTIKVYMLRARQNLLNELKKEEVFDEQGL